MKHEEYEELLKAYSQLWNTRVMNESGLPAKELLVREMIRELKDEYSHPRVRKSKEQKFFYSIKRVADSQQSEHLKMKLISLYIELYESI